MIFDLIIPSKTYQHTFVCIKALENLPYPYRLHLITEGNSWPKAVNIGFSRSTQDVILMDDDVYLLPDTFKDFEDYYPYADIFGFKLLFPDGRVQHGGAAIDAVDNVIRHRGLKPEDGSIDEPCYIGHVTTSLCVIKRHVYEQIKIAENYPGVQFEDVDFMFRAQDAGFRIMYLPNAALHEESKTKKMMIGGPKGFILQLSTNGRELQRRFKFAKYAGIQPFQFPEDPCIQ